MKGFRGTLIALVVVVALAFYAYFFEFKKSQDEEAKKTKESVVLGIDPEKIIHFELHNSVNHVVVDKKDGKWQMRSPVEDLADTPVAKAYLDNLSAEKIEEVVVEGDGIDFKQYGLDQPVTRLVLKSEDGKQIEFKVGAKSFDTKLYAQVDNQKKVLLVSSDWDAQLTKPAKDFRDRRVFRSDSINDADQVEINSRQGKVAVHIVKKDGQWTLAGDDLPLSNDAVKTLLDQLKSMRGSDFLKEDKNDLAKYFLNAPGVTVKISGGKLNWQMAAALAPVPAEAPKGTTAAFYNATSTDLKGIMQIPKASIDGLLRGPETYLQKNAPFDFKTEDVHQVRVQTPELKLELRKQGNDWVAGDGKEIDSGKVSELLTAFKRMEVAEFFPKSEKGKGLSEHQHQIILTSEKGDLLLDFSWGDNYNTKSGEAAKPKADALPLKRTFVKTNKFNRVFGVTQGVVDALPLKALVKTKTPNPTVTQSSGTQTKGTAEKKN